MYAVIFKAEINRLDKSYSETALRMRELAINKYGCTEFIAVTEGNLEKALKELEIAQPIGTNVSNIDDAISKNVDIITMSLGFRGIGGDGNSGYKSSFFDG